MAKFDLFHLLFLKVVSFRSGVPLPCSWVWRSCLQALLRSLLGAPSAWLFVTWEATVDCFSLCLCANATHFLCLMHRAWCIFLLHEILWMKRGLVNWCCRGHVRKCCWGNSVMRLLIDHAGPEKPWENNTRAIYCTTGTPTLSRCALKLFGSTILRFMWCSTERRDCCIGNLGAITFKFRVHLSPRWTQDLLGNKKAWYI